MARFDNLGRALRALRLERRLTQRELARRARITNALLSCYERGTKVPSLRNLGRLLDSLGVDLRQLDIALDRINERGAQHGRSERAEVPGVDLSRFLGLAVVPRDLERPFAEMVLGFQTVSRHLCDRALAERSGRSRRPSSVRGT